MPVAELYRRQAALLVSVVPFVAVEKSFAPKAARRSICSCATCRAFRWTLISPICPSRIATPR